jgi:sortase A
MPVPTLLRLVSWLFIGSALSLGIYAGSNYAYDTSSQSELTAQWDRNHRNPPAPASTTQSTSTTGFGDVFQVQRPRLAVGQPLAKISVPSVRWSGVVLEGSDDRVLAGGPGHVVGSAYPGEPDNVVISNHNTYSLQFGDLKPGDQIILDTDYGHFVYRVTGTRVAGANDRSITAHTDKAQLTFTTCWPLYAGAFATQRFVISAVPV